MALIASDCSDADLRREVGLAEEQLDFVDDQKLLGDCGVVEGAALFVEIKQAIRFNFRWVGHDWQRRPVAPAPEPVRDPHNMDYPSKRWP